MQKEITIAALVEAPIDVVWNSFITPADIRHWNNASDDWHTPLAENDFREGGRFNYRMEAKDKKSGFDFKGIYEKIIPYARIDYTIADGRKVANTFSSRKNGIAVKVTFETEPTHSEERQREGWQAILDNFKKYVENKKDRAQARPVRPCLWFNNQAEEAVGFYRSVFQDSETGQILHYTKAGHDLHGHEAGAVLTIDFRINSQWLTALNGGPEFKFSEAISLQIFCETQAEIDYFWEKLTEGGEETECGWLKDKFGVSWQVTPAILGELLADSIRAERIMDVLLKMKKIDIDALLQA